MAEHRQTLRPVGRWLAIGLLTTLACGFAHAQGKPASLHDEERELVNGVASALQRSMLPSNASRADPELATAARAMVERAMPRIRQAMATWYAEARQRWPARSAANLSALVYARAINEVALWQLDAVDAEHERRRRQAWLHPRACDVPGEFASPMDRLLRVWQGVPAAERKAWVEAEAAALQRWGDFRAPVPSRPMPSAEDLAWQGIEDLLHRGVQPPWPMPLMLAWQVFGKEPLKRRTDAPLNTQCVMNQWALAMRAVLAGGKSSRDGDALARYAHLPTADWWYGAEGATTADDGYPRAARLVEAEGTVTVELRYDASGKPAQALVVARKLSIPALGDQVPVAFEKVFDNVSIARALAMPPRDQAAPQARSGGQVTGRVEFVYKLD